MAQEVQIPLVITSCANIGINLIMPNYQTLENTGFLPLCTDSGRRIMHPAEPLVYVAQEVLYRA
jgi:hypothetical protein